MERKIILGVLTLSLLLLAVTLLIPGGRAPDTEPRLPWDIERSADGDLQVFGLILGRTTLAEARQRFQDQGEVNLFRSPAGTTTIEAYFQRLSISGIKADLILTLKLDPRQAGNMYEHGVRISQLGSGSKKVNLSAQDLALAASLPIGHITYLPSADLDAELVAKLFGEPELRIDDPGSRVTHWLYPDKGLDIGLNPDGKDVLQYLPPNEFDRVVAPLLQARSNTQGMPPNTPSGADTGAPEP